MTRDNPPCHDDRDDGDGDSDDDDDHIVIVILMMRMVLLLVDEIHSNDWPDIYFYVPILILDNIHQIKELVTTASLGIKHQKEKVCLTELDC